MKTAFVLTLLIASAGASPVSKVLELLGGLQAKISKDGEAEQKAYDEYVEWCDDGVTKTGFEIETSKGKVEDLKATISKSDSDVAASATKTEELAGSISANDADLKAATGIHDKEVIDFQANEAELVDTIDTLDRAINILSRKGGSALLQARVSNRDMTNLIHVLSTVVDATALSLNDKQKLVALAQSSTQDDSTDDAMETELGAPAGAVYESKSGSIVDILEDLREKAETQLSEARKEEVNRVHNYNMLKQSLEDDIKFATKEMVEAKASGAEAAETKAVAAGDLASEEASLADAEESFAALKSGCQSAAQDHEASVTARSEELAALGKAKDVLSEMTGGAEAVAYSSASFFQLQRRSGLATRADLANLEVVQLLRQLAHRDGSVALSQLASRVASVVSFGAGAGGDVFSKVKELISGMVAKLEKEAIAEADHKEWCDEQMGDTQEKKDELSHTIDKLSVKIDKATAASAKLKEEVQAHQADLADMAKSQAEADKVRKTENSAFVQTKADLEQGVKGVRMALKVLRDYYGGASLVQQSQTHDKASGAGSSIIGMLEVCEGDFGRSLSEAEMDEDAAATAYQKFSMMNRLNKAAWEKDVEYKGKEATSLDKAITDLSSDRASAQTELDAVLEYSKTVIGACEVKPESYGDRKARRDNEIAGLKEALKVLDGQAVLLQRRSSLLGAAVSRHSQ